MISFAEAPSDASDPSVDLVALTEQIFCKNGWLQQTLGLEHRAQQEAMALGVATALVSDEPLLFEAGTGVGKSLAYLIPGLIRAVSAKRPFLVSSHTIALQQQIEKKDLQICRRLFMEVPALAAFKDFKVSLLVGRGNYLCGHRLARAIETKTDLFGNAESEELQRLYDWSQVTNTGMREELNPSVSPEVWDWVNADSGACNKKNCSPQTCFYRRAQQRRAEANITILNHSLLFSLIAAGLAPAGEAPGVLFAQDFLVLDEAHTVPDTATDHFGIGVSSFAVERVLKRLYTAKGKKPRGLLAKIGDRTDQLAVTKALAASETFFNEVRSRFLRRQPVARLHEPDWIEASVTRPYADLIRRLKVLAQVDKNEKERDELKDQADRLQGYMASIHACIELKDDSQVYWLERGGRQGQITMLRSAPVDVAPNLRETLFQRGTSVTLTSATLTTAGQMSPFQTRAGAHGMEVAVEASPFDYERNMQIYIAEDAPAPSPGQGRLDIKYLADMLLFCASQVEGGTLALFTSHADLAAVAALLEDPLKELGRPLLAQAAGRTRAQLKAEFMEAGNALLCGTDSFWTGFDVPGPALSQVVMTRLPFANPSDPIREARAEAIQAQGGQPFAEMTLPEAVIQFRQGVGRLIRSQRDAGLLTLLDSRLLTKPYGRWFIESLPKSHFERFNRSNRDAVFPLGGGFL